MGARETTKDQPLAVVPLTKSYPALPLTDGCRRPTTRRTRAVTPTRPSTPTDGTGWRRDCTSGCTGVGAAASGGREIRATKSPLGQFNPIASRPAAAAGRAEVGHFEGDLIIGAGGRSAIATVFDRASRHMWLADLPDDHGAESTLAGLVELIVRIPCQLRLTLTWDQGREMARWADLESLCGIHVYFAEAHHPWQRPPTRTATGCCAATWGRAPTSALHPHRAASHRDHAPTPPPLVNRPRRLHCRCRG